VILQNKFSRSKKKKEVFELKLNPDLNPKGVEDEWESFILRRNLVQTSFCIKRIERLFIRLSF
jgi:hypothetical protein